MANKSEIYMFMTSHPFDEVKDAYRQLHRDHRLQSVEHRQRMLEEVAQTGWTEHTGEVPSGVEWRKIGEKLFIREPSAAVSDPSRVTVRGSRQAPRKKTDTSVKKVADLKCPACSGEMFKEGICPGCEEGRRGFKVRLLCGECDYTLSL